MSIKIEHGKPIKVMDSNGRPTSVNDKRSLAYEQKMDLASTSKNSWRHPERVGARKMMQARAIQKRNYEMNYRNANR